MPECLLRCKLTSSQDYHCIYPQVLFDPSRIVDIAVNGAASEVGGSHDDYDNDDGSNENGYIGGAATPPLLPDFEAFSTYVWDHGCHLWQWDEEGDNSKHANSTYWEVMLDTQYVTWIYKEAKTRPRCWGDFRKFRTALLAMTTYKTAFDHYGSERASLSYLDQCLRAHSNEQEVNSEADEVPDDDEEYSELRDE